MTNVARIWFVLLLIFGGLFLYIGTAFGNDQTSSWLARQGYLINILASLTTGSLGGALAIGVVSGISAQQEDARSHRAARAAAGQMVADMMDTALAFVHLDDLPRDWRMRGQRVSDSLQELRGVLRETQAQLISLQSSFRRGVTLGARVGASERLYSSWLQLTTRWKAVLEPTTLETWSQLIYQWGVLEQDVRTRLLAGRDWIPQEVALRVSALCSNPLPVTGEGLLLVADLELRVNGADADTLLEVHAEFAEFEAEGGAEYIDLTDLQALEYLTEILARSLAYLDRVASLTVQLVDLGCVYRPPGDGLRSIEEPHHAAICLGELSNIAVVDREATRLDHDDT